MVKKNQEGMVELKKFSLIENRTKYHKISNQGFNNVALFVSIDNKEFEAHCTSNLPD